ncbi:lysis protein [Atlantibacter hermannii]|uniref:lysis protein n=1 Tax=Atlantibacter hermannii TaxID=565 RepID=UPI0028AB1C65|nr:lysis protein [Atlantibacter hermannii]
MTSKAWLIIGIELLLSVLIIYVLLGQIGDANKRADDAEQNLKLANDTIADMTVRQRDNAALDAKYTKELADANAENDALRKRLDNGGRVRVQGKCPAQDYTTSTGSVGDAGTVELSDVAGRNVLGIRSGIIRDQKALKYLQDYINTQCLK